MPRAVKLWGKEVHNRLAKKVVRVSFGSFAATVIAVAVVLWTPVVLAYFLVKKLGRKGLNQPIEGTTRIQKIQEFFRKAQ